MTEKDELQLKDLEKGDGDADNSTEKSPLKEPDGDGEKTGADGEKGGGGDGNIKEIKAGTGLTSLLTEPKARFVILSIALALILVVVVALVIIVLIAYNQPEPEPWVEDTIPRMLRLIPTPNGPKNMLKFRSGHGSEGGIWPNLTEEIINLYEVFDERNAFGKKNVTNCNSRVSPPNDDRLTCFYDTTEIRKLCRKEDNFGYPDGSPCLFIQFNHVFNFTPEVYTKQDLANDSLPADLRSSYQFQGPWIECKGNEVIDQENSGGIKIAPGREYPRYSFPYRGHSDYMAPFIALKLEKPQTGVTISITCRLWARNVVFNATESGYNDTLVDEEIVPSAILPFNLFIE